MEKGIRGRGNGMERPKQEKECGKKKESVVCLRVDDEVWAARQKL